jgi:hypothetical protein
MKRRLLARLVLTGIAVLIWGYGYRTDRSDLRLVAIVILVLSLVLRFAPARWFGEPESPVP